MPPDAGPDVPETISYSSDFLVIEVEGRVPTAEDLAEPRYGRPDPNRYLPGDELPPETPKR